MTIPVRTDRSPAVPEPGPAGASPPPAPTHYRRLRVVRRRLGLTGCTVAVGFYCLSLTPSLLPRPWLLQGVVSGLTAAMGYGLGAAAGALVRRLWRRTFPGATRIAWRALLAAAPLLGLLFLALGTGWQQDLRARVGMDPMQTYDIIRIVGVSILTFAVLLLIARSLRLATRRVARLLGRFVPRPVAYGVGVLVVAYLAVGFAGNSLVKNLVAVANETASLANGGTDPGVTVPASPLRSGSSASAVRWDTLGKAGRDFVALGPRRADLARFAARPALDPIRVYVGLDSAGSVGERARLAVRELERTGAFDRDVLAVLTPTGTGWVDENVADSLEYMYAGNTAQVSMQYSYLPSWLSFMVDRSKVTDAASALITAVHTRWTALPAASRPKLVLFGESLGSYGTETTYRDLAGLADGADGALLVGPPFANPIWRDLMAGRDPGSPVWDPVHRAEGVVDVARDSTALRNPAATGATVIYLQNSSDPIVWWSPELLVRPPEWLDDPRGPDVSPDMHWYPGITFWQTLVDLAFATGVPAGHGHVYGSGVVDGWAALAAPPDWTTADTVRLRALLDARG